MKWIVVIVVTVFVILSVSAIQAQTADPLDQVYDIAKQLNCPTCGGRSLADCPTETCTQWKQEIKVQLDTGKTPQEIIGYFRARFGPTVLQEPPKEGAILLLWTLPIAALVTLAVAAIVVIRRATAHGLVLPFTPRSDTEATTSSSAVDRYTAELEEDVRKAS